MSKQKGLSALDAMFAIAGREGPFLVWTEECCSGFHSQRKAQEFAGALKGNLSELIVIFQAEFNNDGSPNGLKCLARFEQNPKPPAE